MAIRTIFLDFGGTLVEAFRDAYPTYDQVLRPLGHHVPRDRWAEAEAYAFARMGPVRYAPRGRNPPWGDRVAAEVLRRLRIDDAQGKILESLHQAFTASTAHPPFPDAEPAVRALRHGGYGVHVLSNNTDYLPETIAQLGWTDLFDGVTYSQEAGAEKPDRRVFELALRRSSSEPLETIHVGDSWEADYEGAARAGLQSVWLNRAGRAPPAPCEHVRDLRQFALRFVG